MAKDKDTEKQEIPLTEWQQRNLEFLKKKQEEKREKEKLNKKKMAEKKAQFQTDKEADSKESDKQPSSLFDDKKQEEPKKKPATPKKIKKEKKVPKLPRKDYWQAAMVIIISSIVLIASLFMISPLSRQKEITVSGNKNAIESQLIEELGIKKSDYLTTLLFQANRFERNLKSKDKWVKEAKLVYHFPNHFTLRVKEYRIIAYRQTDKGYVPILENGTRVDTVNASELPGSFVTINLDQEKEVRKLVQKLAKLDKSLVGSIKVISSVNSSSTKDLLLLEMKDNNSVRVPLSEIDTKLPYYSKIKKNLTDGSIVDMEVGIYSTTADIEASIAEHKTTATTESSENSSNAENTDSTQSSEANSQEGSQSVTQATVSQ